MAYNSAPGRAEYTASAAQTVFPFSFKIYSTSDIKVYQTPSGQTADDATDILIETTDYTVTINGDLGGDVTLLVGTVAGDAVTLQRELPIIRPIEYQQSGDLLASTLNTDQDYQTYLIADKEDDGARHLTLGDAIQGVSTLVPNPEALKLLGWSSGEDKLENFTIGDDTVFINIYNTDSIADLLLVDPTIYETVNVRGYYAPNDGGGGIFNYDATQSAVNNGVTIFDGWERQYSGAINVLWGGASGDGVTPQSDIIQNVLDLTGDIYFPLGEYYVDDTEHNALLLNGFFLRSNTNIIFEKGAKILLKTDGSYAHIFTNASGAINTSIRNAYIKGDAFANGFAILGVGGGYTEMTLIDCKVDGIKSEIIISAEATISQNQGGAAYVIEVEGSAKVIGCKAINSQFAIRYGARNSYSTFGEITNFYAEGCEAILNTNPSQFDNRDYSYLSPYQPFGIGSLAINGLTFKNCGKSSDARVNASFKWIDAVSGNYHPHAGQKYTSAAGSTYQSGYWAIIPYNVADAEYSSVATYNLNDTVKVTNNGTYGALFSFGRCGNVSINNVRGYNDTAVTGTIGAIARGIMRNISISDVQVDISVSNICLSGTSPSTSMTELQPFMISENVFLDNIVNIGVTQNVLENDMPINGTWRTAFDYDVVVDYQYNSNNFTMTNIKTSKAVTSILGSKIITAPAQTTNLMTNSLFKFKSLAQNFEKIGTLEDIVSTMQSTTKTGTSIALTREEYVLDGVSVGTKEVDTNGTNESIAINQRVYKWTAKNNVGSAASLIFSNNYDGLYFSNDGLLGLGTDTARMRRIFLHGDGVHMRSFDNTKKYQIQVDNAGIVYTTLIP